ncbi:hypothetical protein MJH12_08330 [bacterium]|nr:hypothetical protein [bacterium]
MLQLFFLIKAMIVYFKDSKALFFKAFIPGYIYYLAFKGKGDVQKVSMKQLQLSVAGFSLAFIPIFLTLVFPMENNETWKQLDSELFDLSYVHSQANLRVGVTTLEEPRSTLSKFVGSFLVDEDIESDCDFSVESSRYQIDGRDVMLFNCIELAENSDGDEIDAYNNYVVFSGSRVSKNYTIINSWSNEDYWTSDNLSPKDQSILNSLNSFIKDHMDVR